MDQLIYGKLELKDKQIPFFMKGRIVTIAQTPYEYRDVFQGITHLDKIVGATNTGKTIALMDCSFSRNPFRDLYSNIVFSVSWYALLDPSETTYDKVCFQSDALNAFFPTAQVMNLADFGKEVNPDGSYNIQLCPNDRITKEFVCNIDGESITFRLAVDWMLSFKQEDSQIGRRVSKCLLSFPSAKTIESLSTYYLWLYDFLVFATFRQGVVLDQIQLMKNEPNGTKEIGTAYFFTKHQGFEAVSRKTITYDDIGDEHISRLFETVAVRRKDYRFDTLYIPENDEESRSVDIVRWLSAAVAFEGEFDAETDQAKFETDPRITDAKDALLSVIDSKVAESRRSINHEINKGYKRIQHLIRNVDTTQEEMFLIVSNKYANIIKNVQNKYMQFNKVTASNQELAKRWAEYRNRIAHGALEPMDGRDFVNYLLSKIFIYLLILDRSGIEEERQKRIIEKLF